MSVVEAALDPDENLLIFGASARSAAYSALRANLRPWCADLFGDQDLHARCPITRVPASAYPQAFLEMARRELHGPWIYLGALENWPALIEEMVQVRPLWGNDHSVLQLCRSPFSVADCLRQAEIAHPAVLALRDAVPRQSKWLQKPFRSAGGIGIRFWTGRELPGGKGQGAYLQEYIEGDPSAAVYVGDGQGALLLGVTRQLVGENWLHARPFQYCGSLGPLPLSSGLRDAFERLGEVLANRYCLRGLFGVDCVLRDFVPYPVEINPRYTASVEVLEYALGLAALALHCRVFDSKAPAPRPVSDSGRLVGKAILFAQAPLHFPSDGPWMPTLQAPAPAQELPAFADIPPAGERIDCGRPILTFFAREDSAAGCIESLRQIALALDHWLFKR